MRIISSILFLILKLKSRNKDRMKLWEKTSVATVVGYLWAMQQWNSLSCRVSLSLFHIQNWQIWRKKLLSFLFQIYSILMQTLNYEFLINHQARAYGENSFIKETARTTEMSWRSCMPNHKKAVSMTQI